jgi:gamma-butyrobetaine dioxygenase
VFGLSETETHGGITAAIAWAPIVAGLALVAMFVVHSHRAERPLIDVDPLGRIREVRFNNRSMQPLRLAYDDLVAFYSAYRGFAEIVSLPESMLTFRLEPGDCLMFDNVRLLHARTAFTDRAHGNRWLQGCYADLDGLNSAVAVLEGAR